MKGFTHEEIAGVLNIHAGTSKSQLFTARRKLRIALGAGPRPVPRGRHIMDNEPDTPLEEAARLREEPVPPAMLESRVVAALARRWPDSHALGLVFICMAREDRRITSDLRHGRDRRPLRVATVAPQAAPAQPRYLLLLAGDVTPAADGSTRAAEYGEWARGLGARGIAVSGDELTSHAELVTNTRSRNVPGPLFSWRLLPDRGGRRWRRGRAGAHVPAHQVRRFYRCAPRAM